MKLHIQKIFYYVWILLLNLPVVAFAVQNSEISKQSIEDKSVITTASTSLDVLSAKVDLLVKINDQLMNSVYWTLGTLAFIFAGLISVNLYFNIRANKREINKIKEDAENLTKSLIQSATINISNDNAAAITKEITRTREDIANITSNLIKTSEVSSMEKTNTTIQIELGKSETTIKSLIKNEILTQSVEIDERLEKSLKEVNKQIDRIRINLKEVEAFKYSQQGKQGAIINYIDILEYDIKQRPWNIKYVLDDIEKKLESISLDEGLADKLKKLLSSIKEKDLEENIKRVLNNIEISKSK